MEKRMKKKKEISIFPTRIYLFTIPALAVFCTFWIYPVFQLVYYSFTNFNGINPNYEFVALDNYARIFENGTLINSVTITLIYATIVVVFNNLIGLGVALLVNTKIKFKGLFRTSAYFPALFSSVVVGFIWSYVYMPKSGMIANMLELFGFDGSQFNPLGSFTYALFAIAIIEVWKGFGTTMIIYLAGLQTIDNSLIEAAKVDGCREWQLIRFIKVPLIYATITINFILSVIGGLKAFDFSFIMTNGGPGKSTKTLMFQIYEIAFDDQKMGRASAFSVVAFLVIIIITIILLYFMNKKEVEA